MQIIKDRQLVENTWQFIADDQELPASGNITVSAHRWQAQHSQLQAHPGDIGLRLSSTDNTDSISGLEQLALIELDFPVFTDGRLFSHARLLRSKYGYNGEIRARGQFLADQVFYLSRIGVNAFELESKLIPTALAALDDFSVFYQTTAA
jgi:uncharacterized protein (DUF934 family)